VTALFYVSTGSRTPIIFHWLLGEANGVIIRLMSWRFAQDSIEVPGNSCDVRFVQYVSKERYQEEPDVDVDSGVPSRTLGRERHQDSGGRFRHTTLVVRKRCDPAIQGSIPPTEAVVSS
jgi:hypothetical protein